MRVSDSSAGGEAAQFYTTRWTLVMASAQDQSEAGRGAFAALCQIYWYPLYAFARRRGYSPRDSEDLTQGFFLHILNLYRRVAGRSGDLSAVALAKGECRDFKLASRASEP